MNQIVIRSHLDRKEFAKGVGCGKSALNQNPALWESLESLEGALREVDFFEILMLALAKLKLMLLLSMRYKGMNKERLDALLELSKLDQEMGRYDDYSNFNEKTDNDPKQVANKQGITPTKPELNSKDIEIDTSDLGG